VIGQLVKSKFLIDGRNALDRDKWRKAGWRVHALGRSD
jgi:UDPglucose 6-dehydrogenase